MGTMDPAGRAVKSARRYDSTGRLRAAERTRTRVLDVARERFVSNGYAATTVAAIAAAAGVSVETIYKSHGGKAGLVRALRDAALQGGGPVPAEQRSDEHAAAASDPREIIAGWGRLTSEVMPRVAPILLLVRSAAGADDEMAVVRRETEDGRLARMEHNARYLVDGGHVRAGLDLERVRDVLFAYSSPELYELLVLRQGWPTDDYSQFVADSIAAALLPPLRGGD
jgi:AcrR family transcriptional regulator